MLTEEQRKERRKGIGGSDVAAILGLSPYQTAMQVWLEKTGREEPEDISDKPAVYWGNVLEAVVANEYAKTKGCKLKKVNKTLKHPKYPWLIAHLDRKIVGILKLLECKTASLYAKEKWGAAGTDHVPENYIMQVQHYLAVTGYELADLAVLIGGSDFRIYEIPRDEEIINFMIEKINDFWHNNVLADIPPQPTSRIEVEQLYKRDNGEFIEASDDILLTINQYKDIKIKINQLEEERKRKENEITRIIGMASGIIAANQVIATWKANKNGSRTLKFCGE